MEVTTHSVTAEHNDHELDLSDHNVVLTAPMLEAIETVARNVNTQSSLGDTDPNPTELSTLSSHGEERPYHLRIRYKSDDNPAYTVVTELIEALDDVSVHLIDITSYRGGGLSVEVIDPRTVGDHNYESIGYTDD